MPQISVPLYSLTSRCPLLSVKGNLEFSMRIPIPQQRRPDDTFYVAQPGDDFMKLAFQFYGDVRLWWVIYDANADQILGHPLEALTGHTEPGPNLVTESSVLGLFVGGQAVPWLNAGGLNPAYEIAPPGTPPVSVPVSAGQEIQISATGLVQYGVLGFTGPNGAGGPTGDGFAMMYVPGNPLGVAGLCGSFTDNDGNVIKPIAIGASAVLVVPVGATQLLLGINQDFYGFDRGSFTVNMTIKTTTPTTIQTAALTLRIPSRQAVEAELLDGPNV